MTSVSVEPQHFGLYPYDIYRQGERAMAADKTTIEKLLRVIAQSLERQAAATEAIAARLSEIKVAIERKRLTSDTWLRE